MTLLFLRGLFLAQGELQAHEKQANEFPQRMQDTVFQGCRVTVFAPGSRRVLMRSHISKYDAKSNTVTLVDKFEESLISVQKAVIKQREEAARAKAARAAKAAEEDEDGGVHVSSMTQGKIPASAGGEAQKEVREENTTLTYAIPWLDYLARAVPLSIAGSKDFSASDACFIIRHCLRIPPSRNARALRPYARPHVRFVTSAEEEFPALVSTVQLIVSAEQQPLAAAATPAPTTTPTRTAIPTPTPTHLTQTTSSPSTTLATSDMDAVAATTPDKTSVLLTAKERLLAEPMPVIRLERAVGRGCELVSIGFYSRHWPRRGHLRVVLCDGREMRCEYREVHGQLPLAHSPGPCLSSQMTARDLSLLVSAFQRKQISLKHWDDYADLCSSGFGAREALLLEPWQVSYVLTTLPPCIYAQLDSAAVNFLLQHFGMEELTLFSRGQVGDSGGYGRGMDKSSQNAHPLALLDRYTLSVVEEQYENGLRRLPAYSELLPDYPVPSVHQRTAHYLCQILACKKALPHALYARLLFGSKFKRVGVVVEWLLHMHMPPRAQPLMPLLQQWHSALARTCSRHHFEWRMARDCTGLVRSVPETSVLNCAQMVAVVAEALAPEDADGLSLRGVACLLSYLQMLEELSDWLRAHLNDDRVLPWQARLVCLYPCLFHLFAHEWFHNLVSTDKCYCDLRLEV
jgi:hypothetical protein